MSRRLAGLLLALVPGIAVAAPAKPIVPCGGQVYAIGGSTLMAEGVAAAGSTDFATRMEAFFERVCEGDVKFETIVKESGRLIDDDDDAIPQLLARSRRSVAFIHLPFTDVEAGSPVDVLLKGYRAILDSCAASGSICIIGGQQPVNALSKAATERQLELERRASAAFGRNYLPFYRHFQSESDVRRLMIPLDSGDGRFVNDFGHDLLYKLYRQRLIELTKVQNQREPIR